MKFKRMLCIMVTLIMTMGLSSGCGSDSAKNNSANDNDSTKQSSQNTSSENTSSLDKQEQTASDGAAKTLVVYYSATGSTEKVAQTIAKTTGADIFEITPVDKYTNDDLDWTDDDSRVSKEYNDESLRDVELTQVTPDNWESYDTVLVGYPIWWGIAAWPVNNFIKENDFSGKRVIPVCTSASSGIGNSGKLLEKMAGTGNWKDGHRFSSSVSASDVQSWVESLNISN